MKCSTPFGITASGTRYHPLDCPGDCSSVLNAFRHHGERDAQGIHELRRPEPVLNAFRHHGERDYCSETQTLDVALCSTPFGITASGTARMRGDKTIRVWFECSTPFGITASGTEAKRSEAAALEGKCSTPFGITASGTSPWRCCARVGQVLNAFRHHGERDRGVFLGTRVDNSGCAQRLSASRRAGPCSGVTMRRRSPCAQRLSASRRAGPSRAPGRPTCARSAQRLSASRRAGPDKMRQCLSRSVRCSTPFGITASGTLEGLVSALQAECSTPFGITASGTKLRVRKAISLFVLNAFRHHGERDPC